MRRTEGDDAARDGVATVAAAAEEETEEEEEEEAVTVTTEWKVTTSTEPHVPGPDALL